MALVKIVENNKLSKCPTEKSNKFGTAIILTVNIYSVLIMCLK